MAVHKPLIFSGGVVKQLPSGDSIEGVGVGVGVGVDNEIITSLQDHNPQRNLGVNEDIDDIPIVEDYETSDKYYHSVDLPISENIDITSVRDLIHTDDGLNVILADDQVLTCRNSNYDLEADSAPWLPNGGWKSTAVPFLYNEARLWDAKDGVLIISQWDEVYRSVDSGDCRLSW